MMKKVNTKQPLHSLSMVDFPAMTTIILKYSYLQSMKLSQKIMLPSLNAVKKLRKGNDPTITENLLFYHKIQSQIPDQLESNQYPSCWGKSRRLA